MTEPTTDAREQDAGTAGAASILLNFFEAHNVGHVTEALHYCLGHHRANPDMRLSMLLNALAPTELALLCPFVESDYPVKLPGYPEDTSGLATTDCLSALRDVPGDWDYVLDNPRRTVKPHLEAVPGFALYYEASDLHFRARMARTTIGSNPPGYVPQGHLRLELPRENRLRVRDIVSSGKPRIAILPGGSSERWLYPRHSAAEQQQVRGDSTGAADRKPEVVRIELLGGFRLWVGPRVIELKGKRSVENHIGKILKKLGFSSRARIATRVAPT